MSAATNVAAPVSVHLREIVQDYPAPNGTGVTRVIDGIDLQFSEPGINMLLGPSGCGKSTLLRMMGGVRPIGVPTPTTGSVLIDGQPCTGAHDDAVMVFQRYANRPDLTVWDNVAYPFKLKLWKQRVPRSQWQGQASEVDQLVTAFEPERLLEWRHEAERLGGQPAPRFATETAVRIKLRSLGPDATEVVLESRQQPADPDKEQSMRANSQYLGKMLETSLERLDQVVTRET